MGILIVLLVVAAAALCYMGYSLYRIKGELPRLHRENLHLRNIVTCSAREASLEREELQQLHRELLECLQATDTQPVPGELLRELESPVDQISGSSAVDALSKYYKSQADALGFAADLHLETGPLQPEMLPDVCLVLSNLLDNSLEAMQREGGGWLRARCHYAEDYLSLVVGNSSTATLRSAGGRYLSDKPEVRHGVGLATVQNIASKYGGTAEFTADGKEFRASVFLPCSAPATQNSVGTDA